MAMGEGQPTREQKHIQIDSAIHELRSAVILLVALREQINPTPQVAERLEGGKDRAIPTLMEILDTLPVRIRDEAETINKTVAEIRELIF